MDSKKNIVILGAGFGGLRSALVLGRNLKKLGLTKQYEVILVDRNDYHTYTPLLYEIATTSKEIAGIAKLHEISAYPLHPILKKLPIKILQGEVGKIDTTKSLVLLNGKRSIVYDRLIIALGSETHDRNIPGLREHAFFFKTFRDAVALRNKIWDRAMEGEKKTRVVVGGAGSTGVELAGELESWCRQLARTFPKCGLEIALLDGGSAVLGNLDPHVGKRAQKRLSFLGVKTMLKVRIKSVASDMVMLEDGEKIPFDAFVWAGGIKGLTIASKLPYAREKDGRIEVNEKLECSPTQAGSSPQNRIYAIGDAACFHSRVDGKPVPAVARAAISQANIVAHNITEEIKAMEQIGYRAQYKTYHPIHYPYIVPVGGKFAVAKIGPIIVSGFWGWIFKGLVELNYLASIMPKFHAIIIWLKGLNVFIQNDRLG